MSDPLREVAAVCLLAFAWGGPVRALDAVLDDFGDVGAWQASASEGASLEISQGAGHTGHAMRLDFDLGTGGYVIAHRSLPVQTLPANFSISFFVRGAAPANTLEVKLVDPGGRNVWWHRLREFDFPARWRHERVKKVQLDFAWGPSGGEPLRRIGAIEFALTAGSGGKGSVWISDLRLQSREVADPGGVRPTASASSELPGHPAALALDRSDTTGWHSDPTEKLSSLVIDLGRTVEYGGLVIDWDAKDYATAYRVLVSEDGKSFEPAYEAARAAGGRSFVYMHDTESRWVKLEMLQSSRGRGYGIGSIEVRPYRFSESPNAFFEAVARSAPRGLYPRYLLGEQTYWTVVGTADGAGEALLNEDGALEVDKGAFTLEPFLYADGRLIDWNGATSAQDLRDGYLPIPSVTWRRGDLMLRTTAFAADEPGIGSTLYVRYRVRNHGRETLAAQLYVALRPFQVNPPWQALNMVGGVSSIREMARRGRAVWVNREKVVVALDSPDGFGAAVFDQGSVTGYLRRDEVPPEESVKDEFGYASGAFRYRLDLQPGEARDVYFAVPFHPAGGGASDPMPATAGGSFARARLDTVAHEWAARLARIDIRLPPSARKIVDTLKTTVAYILINRDGAAIRPGARDYARSWIRDGALTSAALLEMGYPEEVREFLRWYARYQFADGRIPCCVDARGADPVEENDSNGEFIYAVMAYFRFTNDVEFLREMWPHVVKAVEYIEYLRAQRMTAEYRSPEGLPYFGLAPESISHEGYSSHPVHSYWDDFFLLRGLKDAAGMAKVLGDTARAERFAAVRDDFRKDLYASIERAVQMHRIDFIPGSVELGDFDPTSTSIAISPGGELAHLPARELARTFQRYFSYFLQRRSGEVAWQAYTPYELRNVGTLVRLGERNLALEALEYFLGDQRPAAWNEWAEVVWRDPRAPRFIGDMPHTWVGSGFIRSVRSMFVYGRESDHSLVLAAGVPRAWIDAEPGVVVRHLPSVAGPVSYRMRAAADGSVHVHVDSGPRIPAGGIIVTSPLEEPLREVTVDGRPLHEFDKGSVRIRSLPAEIVLR